MLLVPSGFAFDIMSCVDRLSCLESHVEIQTNLGVLYVFFTNNFCQLPPLFKDNYAVQPLKPKATNQSYERRLHCQFFHVHSTESLA